MARANSTSSMEVISKKEMHALCSVRCNFMTLGFITVDRKPLERTLHERCGFSWGARLQGRQCYGAAVDRPDTPQDSPAGRNPRQRQHAIDPQ